MHFCCFFVWVQFVEVVLQVHLSARLKCFLYKFNPFLFESIDAHIGDVLQYIKHFGKKSECYAHRSQVSIINDL